MWWEPRNSNEIAVNQTIERLTGWFREHWSSDSAAVWGLGSIMLGEPNRIFPLLVVGPDFPDLYRGYPFGSYHFPCESQFLERLPLVMGEWREPFPFFPRAGLPLRILFPDQQSSVPFGTSGSPVVLLPASRPRPTSRPSEILDKFVAYRRPIVCGLTGKVGTAGFTAQSPAGPVVISAGHVFPEGDRSPVLEERGVRVGRFNVGWGRKTFGKVMHQVAPAGPVPGYDVAVIAPNRPLSASHAATRFVEKLDEPKSVVVHGSTSGTVTEAAALIGALVQVGDPATSTIWANCWMMGPSESLTGGDSGAAVFVQDDSSLLGTVVGASYFKASGRRLIHYVQDGFSLQRNVLQQWNIQL